jgi:hypothetical protein
MAKQKRREYRLYVRTCEEFGEQPALTQAAFSMTSQQKHGYKLYINGCRENGIEPTRADFLLGDIPKCVTYHMEIEQNENEWERQKAMAATAGR